jgi:amino-acid N-acetyltransferase
MYTRKALLPDAEHIYRMIAAYSGDGTLLPRTLAEICENVRDFVVLERESVVRHTEIVGCGALHLYGPHLAEIRSITVSPLHQSSGGGRLLVDALLAEAAEHKVTSICLFTRIPDFFARLNFNVVVREQIPDKMYKDCLNCPRLHSCDEVAMVLGDLPKISILGHSEAGFVRLFA